MCTKMIFLHSLLISAVPFVICAEIKDRIIGGENARPGQFPYQVSLQCGNRHICGGSILNEKYILTAAHCVDKIRPSNLKIVTGTTNLKKINQTNIYLVERIIKHPDYVTFRRNDIALIKVAKDITFDEKVKPIKISKKTFKKSKVTVSGWGRTSNTDYRLPNILQFIDLKTINNKRCQQLLSARIQESHICTLTRRGEGICFGDSGSPLVKKKYQVGIVSFCAGCGLGRPDVYTRVSYFVKWIQNVMDQNSEENSGENSEENSGDYSGENY